MVDVRTLLAAVIGVCLGVLFVLRPEFVIRVQTVGRLPDGRGSRYGTESSPPENWLRLVRLVGVALLLVGGYFGFTALAGGPV